MITRARRLRIYRFSVQIAALIGLNLQFLNIWFGNVTLTGAMGVCAPGLYCHGCPWAPLACPLGVLVNAATLRVVPLLALGTLALVGALGGRLVCGWVCPFGWLQDMLNKIRGRKYRIPGQLEYVKYAILVVFVLLIPYLLPGRRITFCDGCPSGFLESLAPNGFMGHWDVESGLFSGFTTLFFVKLGITIAVLVFCVLVSKGFCRMLCPLGAIFGLFNRFSLFRYGLTYHKCTECGACAKVCPVDIDPTKDMNHAACIRCHECTTTRHIKMGVR